MNSLNATFATDPVFRAAIQQVLTGANRDDLDTGSRTVVDFYLISNLQEQLVREIRAGILDVERLLHEFEGAAEQLDRQIREFVAAKIRSATMDEDVVEVAAEPNSATPKKPDRLLMSVALIIAVVLAISATVAFLQGTAGI